MSQLQKLLSGPESRLTALVGESGAGKTRLAYEAAHQLAEEFEDGAWLIRLNGGQQSVWSCSAADDVHVPVQRWTDDDELALPIARSLGLSPVGQTPLAVQLADHLCHREVLLVLDGFQPERWDAETLHRLIRGAPLARILVVSERPVDADWLETLRIGGLSTPPEGTQALSNSREPDNLAGEGALALFLSGARRAVPGLDFDGHTADHIVRLCQLVSGSPLAIKLLTATVGRVPLGEIARRLERLAKKASSSSEDRQDSRSATRCAFAYAWEVLSQDEQFLLSKLVIFEHDFDEEAALEVVGADPTELKELVDTSWLDRLGAGRYIMHRGLRAFVQLKVKEIAWGDYELGTSADASKVSERYRKHYLRLVMTRKQMLVGPTARAACAEIQREWRAVRNAWLQAVAEGQLDLLEKTLEGLTRFLLLVGWLWEGERILHATSTALLRQSRDVGGSLLMARILAHRARALNVQRRGEEGVAAAQAALDSMPNGSGLEAPARAAEAEALVEWGRGLSLQGEFQLATERLKQALTLTGDDQAVETKARAFHSLGVIALSTESYEEALAYLRRALALYDVMDHRTGGAAVRNDLGMAAIRQRQYPDAAAYLGDALSLAQKTGDRRQEGVAYSHFGRLAAAQGDYDRATGHLERALRIAIDLGDRYVQAEVQVELAASLLHQGETGQAWKRSILAVEISHALGERASEARAWLVAGHVFSELNMLDQATRSCRMALELARTFGGSMLITEALACLARIGLARDDLGRARSLVEQILGRLETQSLPGGSEALRVYLICYQVLKAAKDSRADDVLSRVSSLYGQEEGGASVHYSPNGGSELPDGEDVPRL
jgi:predicted ATPase